MTGLKRLIPVVALKQVKTAMTRKKSMMKTEDDEGTGSFTEMPEGSIAGSELAPDQTPKAVTRKASAIGVAAGAAAGGGP